MAAFDNVTAPGWPTSLPFSAQANLTAAAGTGQATLIWSPPGTALNYNVKRSITHGGPYTVVSNVTATNYTDTGLTNGMTYSYAVSALNLSNESTNSAPVRVVPIPCINIAWTAGHVTLTWPLASDAFTLQSSTNLVLGGWIDVASPPPQPIGNRCQVVLALPADESLVLYRLAK